VRADRANRMSTRHPCRRTVCCVAALVLTTACACTTLPTSPGPAAVAPNHPAATEPARAGVQDLCARFTIAALGSDTTTDAGPADARRRAAQQFGTPALIDRLAGEGRDPRWRVLAEHRGRVQVSTTTVADDPPPQDGDHAGAAVLATRTAVADNGWRDELPSTVAYCALQRTQDGWKVADVTFSDTTNSERSE